MTYQRWPHTGTLAYITGAVTYNTQGYRTVGTKTSLGIHCNVQPNKASMVRGTGGDSVVYRYDVSCPLLVTTFVDTQGLEFKWNGTTYRVIDLMNFQEHTEFQV